MTEGFDRSIQSSESYFTFTVLELPYELICTPPQSTVAVHFCHCNLISKLVALLWFILSLCHLRDCSLTVKLYLPLIRVCLCVKDFKEKFMYILQIDRNIFWKDCFLEMILGFLGVLAFESRRSRLLNWPCKQEELLFASYSRNKLVLPFCLYVHGKWTFEAFTTKNSWG